jgi:hypothetical protein
LINEVKGRNSWKNNIRRERGNKIIYIAVAEKEKWGRKEIKKINCE